MTAVATSEPTSSDSNQEKRSREYVVLEAENLASLLDRLFPEEFAGELPQDLWDRLEAVALYTHVATLPARNTEHALQQAGVKSNGGATPTLVPIASRHFRPETITVDRSPRVVIG